MVCEFFNVQFFNVHYMVFIFFFFFWWGLLRSSNFWGYVKIGQWELAALLNYLGLDNWIHLFQQARSLAYHLTFISLFDSEQRRISQGINSENTF